MRVVIFPTIVLGLTMSACMASRTFKCHAPQAPLAPSPTGSVPIRIPEAVPPPGAAEASNGPNKKGPDPRPL